MRCHCNVIDVVDDPQGGCDGIGGDDYPEEFLGPMGIDGIDRARGDDPEQAIAARSMWSCMAYRMLDEIIAVFQRHQASQAQVEFVLERIPAKLKDILICRAVK